MTTYEMLDLLGNTWIDFRCRNCGESFRDSLHSLEHNPYGRRCSGCGTDLPLTQLVPLVTSIRNCLNEWTLEISEAPPVPTNGGLPNDHGLIHA